MIMADMSMDVKIMTGWSIITIALPHNDTMTSIDIPGPD